MLWSIDHNYRRIGSVTTLSGSFVNHLPCRSSCRGPLGGQSQVERYFWGSCGYGLSSQATYWDADSFFWLIHLYANHLVYATSTQVFWNNYSDFEGRWNNHSLICFTCHGVGLHPLIPKWLAAPKWPCSGRIASVSCQPPWGGIAGFFDKSRYIGTLHWVLWLFVLCAL